jgi:hypothetical protein
MAAAAGARAPRRRPLAIEGPAVLEARPDVGWPEQWAAGGEAAQSPQREHAEAVEATAAHPREPQPAPRKGTLFGRLIGLVGPRRDT